MKLQESNVDDLILTTKTQLKSAQDWISRHLHMTIKIEKKRGGGRKKLTADANDVHPIQLCLKFLEVCTCILIISDDMLKPEINMFLLQRETTLPALSLACNIEESQNTPPKSFQA